MDEIIALIPARGGSKGIPNKNLTNFLGKPLLSHTIEFAIASQLFSRVIVSTDSIEIAKVAQEFGAEVPFLRPEILAQDNSAMVDVIKNVIEMLEMKEGPLKGYITLLDPTSPVRLARNFSKALFTLDSYDDYDGAIAVSEPSFNPLWVGVRILGDNSIQKLQLIEGTPIRRQDVPRYWRINGGLYIWRIEVARSMNYDYLTNGRYLAVETDEVSSFSIDTKEDLAILEALIKSGLIPYKIGNVI